MIPEKRRKDIIDYVNMQGFVTIQELSKVYGCSEVTVRRDLDILSKSNLINKIYGGVSSKERIINEPVFLENIKRDVEEKRLIAEEASKRISNGNVVLLESGSTCLELVKFLAYKKNLKVITTGLHILNAVTDLQRNGIFDGEVLCCGGIWKKDPDIFIGPQAIEFFKNIRIDVSFFGIVAISLDHGWAVPNILEAELTNKIISCSEKIIGITIHSKFEKSSFYHIGALNIFNEIITDKNINKTILNRYIDNKINVTTY